MSTEKISFLLNWHATPYHAPIFLAQSKGFYKEEGIEVAILEPNDPSDVTEMIGSGMINMGAKAMVHTLAAKARGFPVTSIGSLMDEPFTGVVYLHGSGVTEDFQSLKGKRIGYVGEFGKIQIDELTKYYNMKPEDYTAVRVGMRVSESIIDGTIDAGIGLENVQMVELEEWCKDNNRPTTDVRMLRIDVLAELGCCCFCTILYIANDDWLAKNEVKATKFMRAVKKASDFLLAEPKAAWEEFKAFKKTMDTKVNAKIFERSYTYMSKDLRNVERDWVKVTGYCQRLGVLGDDFVMNKTNRFITWDKEPELDDPEYNQILVARAQEQIKAGSGVLSQAPFAGAQVSASA